MLKNYIHKEKIVKTSMEMGIDYQTITRPTFEFLLQIKQHLHGKDEQSMARGDRDLTESKSNPIDTVCNTFIKSV